MSPNTLPSHSLNDAPELPKNPGIGSRRALPELPCNPEGEEEADSKEMPDSSVSEMYATMEKVKELPGSNDEYDKKNQADKDVNPMYCQIGGAVTDGETQSEPFYSLIQPQELYDNIKWDYNGVAVPSTSQSVSANNIVTKETCLVNCQYEYPQFRELTKSFHDSMRDGTGSSGSSLAHGTSAAFPVTLRRDVFYSVLRKASRDSDSNQVRRRFSAGDSDSEYQYAVINKNKVDALDSTRGVSTLMAPLCVLGRSTLANEAVPRLTCARPPVVERILDSSRLESSVDYIGRNAPSYRYLSVREPLESVRRRLQQEQQQQQQQSNTLRNLSMSDTSIHYYSSITENCYEAVPSPHVNREQSVFNEYEQMQDSSTNAVTEGAGMTEAQTSRGGSGSVVSDFAKYAYDNLKPQLVLNYGRAGPSYASGTEYVAVGGNPLYSAPINSTRSFGRAFRIRDSDVPAFPTGDGKMRKIAKATHQTKT